MTGYDGDVARYFADIAERRKVQVSAAAAKIDQVAAAGDRTVAQIEQHARAAVDEAAQAAGAEASSADGARSPAGWPCDELDLEDRLRDVLTGFDESGERCDGRR